MSRAPEGTSLSKPCHAIPTHQTELCEALDQSATTRTPPRPNARLVSQRLLPTEHTGEAPHLGTSRARIKATSPYSPEDSEHQSHLLHRTTSELSVATAEPAPMHARRVSARPPSVRASPTRLEVQLARFDVVGWISRLERNLVDEAISSASAPHDTFNRELWTPKLQDPAARALKRVPRATVMPNRNQPGEREIRIPAEPTRQPARTEVTEEPTQRALSHSWAPFVQDTAEQQLGQASCPHAPIGELLVSSKEPAPFEQAGDKRGSKCCDIARYATRAMVATTAPRSTAADERPPI